MASFPKQEEKQPSVVNIKNGKIKAEKEEEESFPKAIQLLTSSALIFSLQTAIELGVFDIIAKYEGDDHKGQLSPSQIASKMPTKNPEAPIMLDRIFRLLTTYSLLTCSVIQDESGSADQRMYGLTPVSRHFVTNQDGVSLGPLISLLQHKVFLDSWSELKGAILEGGIAFNRFHGMQAFVYPELDPIFNGVFNVAMHNHTTIVTKKMLDSYTGFEKFNKLIDVGGGIGVALNLITSKYPHIKGLNLDLPHVINHAPSYPNVEHVGGDMFQSVPYGDAIFMKWVLHDWSDEKCLLILKNCYKAIPENGKVIVMETVFPMKLDTTSDMIKDKCHADVIMMTQNPGGKERTQQEFTRLATAAGFSGISFESMVCNFWIMEFFK